MFLETNNISYCVGTFEFMGSRLAHELGEGIDREPIPGDFR